MALNIADNFSYLGKKPLDGRLVFDTISDMFNAPSATLYTGLLSYNLEDNKYYIFNHANVLDPTLGQWRELATGDSASASAIAQEYVQGHDYNKDELIYLGNEVVKVGKDFTADTTFADIQESFEEDIKLGNLIVINTNHTQVLNPYIQAGYYEENTLCYCGDYVARVVQTFAANDSEPTTAASFEADIAAGNIIIVNKEAVPGILPYKQGTLFEKDKLVFADGRIGRVLNDYISDSTGATLEDSINIDIKSGNLREMGENYKFKLYKTTQDMNKQVDAINILPLSTIVFENSEGIDNMHLNEAVYGPLGTLSIVVEIDKNLGQIKTKTVSSREVEFMPPAPNDYNFDVALAGAGYEVGDILSTDINTIFVEVTMVGVSGEIISVGMTESSAVNEHGAGAVIKAQHALYVGNGKDWYELPEEEPLAFVATYEMNKYYEKDTLIVYEDILTRAGQNFTSNNTETLVNEAFQADITNGFLIRLTREDVNVPECLGSIKTEAPSDFPIAPVKGNWVLVEDCTISAPGQAGISLYDGINWNTTPIPVGQFQFPEPSDDGKLYFRQRDAGNTEGSWAKFETVNGNEISIKLNTKNRSTNGTDIPENGELVWCPDDEVLLLGDGTTNLNNLKPFYEDNLTSSDIITALGYSPENAALKGQANGYAPLDSNGLVPSANLPSSLTDTYSKSEIDSKHIALTNNLTTLVNTEASRAKGVEGSLRTDLNSHIQDTVRHITQTERDYWNDKVESSDILPFQNHIDDTTIHVTQDDKDRWDGAQVAYYVMNVSDLPETGNQVGNIGYVQISAAGVSPVVCEQYIWDGTAWQLLDVDQVSLQMKWGNILDRPAATPLTLDNAVTVAHSHNNKNELDKIGQSSAGNFTYDGVEIGVKAVFYETEQLLPSVGDEDTLYVVYEDNRTRKYPSISVYKNGAYQILGKGAQESAPVVGDMSILQQEFYSVNKGSTYSIHFTPNQYFCFLPIEILKEIEGLKNQTRIICDASKPDDFTYNSQIIDIDHSSKCRIDIKPYEAILDTVSDYYYSHADVDLSLYKNIDSIE